MKIARLVAALGLLCSLSAVAYGQSPAVARPAWESELELDIFPTFGKEIGGTQGGADRDYSEYAIYLTQRGKDVFVGQDLALKLGAAYDPDQFGDELESRIQAEVTVGQQKYAAHRGRILSRDVGGTDDSWQAWSTLSVAQVWDGFFKGDDHFDTTATIGAAYSNVATIVPGSTEAAKGTWYKVTLTGSRVWSTRETDERWAPKATAVVYSPAIGEVGRLFARGDYELRIFDEAGAAAAKHRVDHRLKLSAGADVAQWFGGTVDTAEVAVLYFKRWSNAPGADFSRGYFAPGLVLIKGF